MNGRIFHSPALLSVLIYSTNRVQIVFMSSHNHWSAKYARKRKLQALGAKYRRCRFYEAGICTYCGDLADSWDHVPALAEAECLDLDRFRNSGGELLLIPSCRKCNSWLGRKPLHTPQERKTYCWSKWVALFHKDFSIPQWDKEELDALGPVLRSYVKTAAQTAVWIRERIAFAELRLPGEPL